MKKALFVVIGLVLLLSACSAGVPQEKYDAVVSELDALKSQMAQTPEPTEEPTQEPTEAPTPEPTPEFGTRKNPIPLGETLTGSLESAGNSLCDFEMRIVSVVRGAGAWTKIKKANMFNDKPTSTTEYVLAKVYIKNTADLTGSDTPLEISNFNFSLATSDDSISNDQPAIVLPKPELSFKLYEGSEGEGYIAFLVNKTDSNIKAVFVDSFWFMLK